MCPANRTEIIDEECHQTHPWRRLNGRAVEHGPQQRPYAKATCRGVGSLVPVLVQSPDRREVRAANVARKAAGRGTVSRCPRRPSLFDGGNLEKRRLHRPRRSGEGTGATSRDDASGPDVVRPGALRAHLGAHARGSPHFDVRAV